MYRIIVFFFFVVTIYAQDYQKKNDSIIVSKEIISFIKTSDSIKQIKKTIERILHNDTLKYLTCNKIFLQRGIDTKNYKLQYYAAYRLGHMYYTISDYPQSIAYAKFAKEASVQLRDTLKNIRSTLLNAGNYFTLHLHDKSLKEYTEVRRLSQKIKTNKFELITLSNIANIRVLLKRYGHALKDYNRTLTILNKQKSKELIGYKEIFLSTLLGKGKCQKKLGDFEKSLSTYEKGLILAEELGLVNYVSIFKSSIGNTYYYMKDYQTAIKYLIEAKKEIQSQYSLYVNTTQVDYFLAQCYVMQNEKTKAIALLEKNFKLNEEKGSVGFLEEMYELRIQIAKKQEDLKTENRYQKKIINLVHRENEKSSNTIDLLHNSDIKKYQNTNQKLAIKYNKINYQKKTAIVIVVLLLLLLISSFIYYKKKNKDKAKRFEEIIKEIQEQHLLRLNEKPKSIIKETQAQRILNDLSKLEKTFFFKSKGCNLYTTAKAIDTNTTYLSKALNEVKKQSFNQYLNELRINYVLLKLKEDTRFRSYTIKAISEEIGYKSVTTFLRAFKAKTNLNPSYYIENLNIVG